MDGPARDKPGTRLPNDGHLSGQGAGLVADLIAARLGAESVLSAPLETKLSIGSVWVRLIDFWGVEGSPAGELAWTKARSELEITGLPPGKPLKVSFYAPDPGPYARLTVVTEAGRQEELAVSSNAKFSLSARPHADAKGQLLLRLSAQPFRPSDRGTSDDSRELGIALSGVEVSTE